VLPGFGVRAVLVFEHGRAVTLFCVLSNERAGRSARLSDQDLEPERDSNRVRGNGDAVTHGILVAVGGICLTA
jgi:hypothetical protein